ncbi:hypothetical protein HGRIS_013647 [Hohenbuehelia grisea]
MLGDIWCLPASAYTDIGSSSPLDGRSRAVPILLGVPHDSDPHFSPDGDRLVWRSDAGLGVENIWITQWQGCEAMDLRPQIARTTTHHNAVVNALHHQNSDETLLAHGVPETEERRVRRLIREGRTAAQRVTNETYRWVSDARFHPSGKKVVATKWYTSFRSLGAGEGWEYPIYSSDFDLQAQSSPQIPVGAGKRLLGRTLPPGWDSATQYGDQQIGPEQVIWQGDDGLIYSKNVADEPQGAFEYSKDVHKGNYAIFAHNLTTNATKTLVDAFPGGASRPELSRDEKTLAFVRRVRDKSVLVLKDLTTGTITHAFDGLTYDLTGISAPMGTYPSFAFTPTSSAQDAIIIWAAGQINYIPLALNDRGERIAHPSIPPRTIPFTAHIEKRVAETLSVESKVVPGLNLVDLETKDTMRVRAFKELNVDTHGKNVVFQAAGVTYVSSIVEKRSRPVPVLHSSQTYYTPSFIPHSNQRNKDAEPLVIHARWSDTEFSRFEIADVRSGRAYELSGLPFGRYYAPIISSRPPIRHSGDTTRSSTRAIAFIKTGGSGLTGNVVATAGTGLYVGDIELPSEDLADASNIEITNVRFIPEDVESFDGAILKLSWVSIPAGKAEGSSATHQREGILVQQSTSVSLFDVFAERNEKGEYPQWTVAEGEMSIELVVSGVVASESEGSWPCRWWPGLCNEQVSTSGDFRADRIAFVDFFYVYFADGADLRGGGGKDGKKVWSKPGNATEGLARLSLDGGHDLAWSGDGKTLFWFLGPFLHSLKISQIRKCSDAIERDASTFGIDCIKKLLHFEEIIIEHSTDIARLKRDAGLSVTPDPTPLAILGDISELQHPLSVNHHHSTSASAVSASNADVLVIYNATLLTMETGDSVSDLMYGGALVSRGGVIESVGSLHDLVVPGGATVIDAQGGFVLPGYIDVHAHWDGFLTRYPAKSWEMETFLAYGVTTLHNPSADNVAGFVERSRVESGQLVGPRIFTVGDIIYGAGAPGIHQDIASSQEAHSALVRIKAEGGPASISYKNYNLPSRASRQRLLLAARNLSMLCVPEGGMNWDWDLTYIIDGMTTVEHSMPVPGLYDDVLNLFALSGTGNTPTHIVNYGGAFGEQFVWANVDVPNDPKLRRFTRHDILEGLTESTARPLQSYSLFNTSASVAKMVRRGLKAHIGAHGEPPLGLNYHAEMFFTSKGGLTNYEVFEAATSAAAKTLGLYSSLGSLSPGKLADFLVYPPGVDLLEDDITHTKDLRYVARGGRVWDASTMVEVWPVKGRKQDMPPINVD